MIRYLVTSTPESDHAKGPGGRSAREFLEDSLAAYARNHDDLVAVDDPARADVIIFAETHQDDPEEEDAVLRVVATELYKQHRRRCVVHSGKDIPRPLLPGIYPSIGRWGRKFGYLGGPYLTDMNPFLDEAFAASTAPSSLASFVGHFPGKRTRIRLRQAAQAAGWERIQIIDCSDDFIASLRKGDQDGHLELKRLFASTLADAKFALCPRGAGHTSFRVFEAMQAGRCPVIIADRWSPPPGPEWERFAVTIPESDMARIPRILESIESEWESRGQQARSAWEKYYAPEVIGAHVVRASRQLTQMSRAQRCGSYVFGRLYIWFPRRIARLRRRLWSRRR